MKTNETKIEVKTDSTFEVGTVYKAFTCGKGYTSYKVTARTAKFVTVENLTDGTVKRCKVDLEEKKHYLNDGYHTDEFIRPDKKAYGITPRDIDRAAKNADAVKTDEKAETAKFETGKTYAAKKSVLFDSQINMTVINRTNCYVTIQFDEDEEDIRRCKIVDDAGVEKIYIHETNAISGDYEFSANDVAEETVTDAVKTDEVSETVEENTEVTETKISDEGLSTFDIGDDTVKFVNGEFYQVFSRKYHAAIVKTDSIAYCIFSDGDTEVHDVSGHEVSYDEFIATLEERGKAQSEVTDAGERKIVIKSKANAKGSVSVTIDGRRESLTDAAIVLQTNHTINGNVELLNSIT